MRTNQQLVAIFQYMTNEVGQLEATRCIDEVVKGTHVMVGPTMSGPWEYHALGDPLPPGARWQWGPTGVRRIVSVAAN